MEVATLGVAGNFVSVHGIELDARAALAAKIEARGGESDRKPAGPSFMDVGAIQASSTLCLNITSG